MQKAIFITMTPYQRIFGSGPLLLLLTAIFIVTAVRMQQWVPLPQLELSPLIRLGLTGLILIIGGTIIIRSFQSLPLQARGRQLVTSGPYRYVRHPLYTAVFLSVGLSVFFITQILWALVAMGLMFLMGHLFVGYEERLMEQSFGQSWQDYARRTPRFLPRSMNP